MSPPKARNSTENKPINSLQILPSHFDNSILKEQERLVISSIFSSLLNFFLVKKKPNKK